MLFHLERSCRSIRVLKTTLQIVDLEEGKQNESKKREKFKSTGVRRLHFAAMCDHQVTETHYNTKVILDHIQAHKVKYTLVELQNYAKKSRIERSMYSTSSKI